MSENLHDFDNKSVIITGAGKGIGRATAIEMNKYGAKVIAMARTQSDLDSLKSDIGCVTIKVDLSDNVAARVAMQKAGTCEFIINNAGTNVLESVLVTEEGYEAVMGEPLRADLDLRPGICPRSCGLWRWWFDLERHIHCRSSRL